MARNDDWQQLRQSPEGFASPSSSFAIMRMGHFDSAVWCPSSNSLWNANIWSIVNRGISIKFVRGNHLHFYEFEEWQGWCWKYLMINVPWNSFRSRPKIAFAVDDFFLFFFLESAVVMSGRHTAKSDLAYTRRHTRHIIYSVSWDWVDFSAFLFLLFFQPHFDSRSIFTCRIALYFGVPGNFFSVSHGLDCSTFN